MATAVVQDRTFDTMVEGLNDEVILGAPFFEQKKVFLNIDRKYIYMGNAHRKTIYFLCKEPPNSFRTYVYLLNTANC